MNEEPTIVRLADDTQQALRALNHRTIHGAIPAPVLYEVLGTLKQLGPALGQLLGQLGEGLAESLTEYDVYEDDGADPADSVAACRAAVTTAAAHAALLGQLLEHAQGTITHQGHRAQERSPRRPSPSTNSARPGPGR